MKQVMLAMICCAGLAACSNEGGTTGTSSPSGESVSPAPLALSADQQAKVDKAVAVRTALEAGQDADAVLRTNGLTEEQFDALMYEIAEDEAMAAAYAARTGP